MCIGGAPKTPKVVQRDPQAEARKAAQEATMKANEESAAIRARKAKNTLMARGAAGVGGTADTLMQVAAGKPNLGS